MIWLASFPRSGNTFFRNVLYEVYGIESSTFHKETTYPVDEDYDQYQVVKSHLLPGQLEPNDPTIKSVYIVRDGRDALVSIAHHRKDLVDPNSDFQINLLEAIIAPKGSHFGGWSENVRQWIERADIIIRFEDLIKDPIKELEKLRSIMDLPDPQRDKLPTFDKLKFGTPEYGSAKKFLDDKDERRTHSSKSFRKGKVGGWKEEMTPEVENLFWEVHGDMMHQLGYAQPSQLNKQNLNVPKTPYKILIEANKLFMDDNDGIKRYQMELLDGFAIFQEMFPQKWEIDLYLDGGTFLSLKDRGQQFKSIPELLDEKQNRIAEVVHEEKSYESKLLGFKSKIRENLPVTIYNLLSWVYRNLPIRFILRLYRGLLAKKEYKRHEVVIKNYDLIHVPLPQNFHFLKDATNKFLVTIHDLTHRSFPEFHTTENIKLSEAGMQDIIRKKANLLAISESTKEDLLKDYPTIKKDQISVIYEACNRSHFRPVHEEKLKKSVLEKYNLPDCPYFLTLSTLEPRKNLLNTIKAFDKLIEESGDQKLALFICGKKGWKTEELFKKENLSNRNIYFTGFVDEEDLPIIYSNALALCYVSIYEGFGLPPLEAMACGIAVLYGDNSSMPEVIGNAGIAADPYDINDIKLKMKQLLNDDIRIEETLNLYEMCILNK